MRLERRAGALRMVRHRAMPAKKFDQGLRPSTPAGKEVKI
jgi:hypothetical protein